MIKIAGAVVLVLGFAISAQTQGTRSSGAHAQSLLNYSGGAGIGADGGGVAAGNFRTLPHVASARFQAITVSGDANNFVPSTFVPYAIAVAEGRSNLAATPESLGQFARDCNATTRTNPKLGLQEHHRYSVVQGYRSAPEPGRFGPPRARRTAAPQQPQQTGDSAGRATK